MQVLLLGLLWAGTQSMAVTVTIGTGTTTTSYPFYTLYEDARTQMLYTASEITAGGGVAGTIQSIALNIASASSLPMNGFSIKMQNTTAATLTGFVGTGWTQVYSGVYTPTTTGWQTFTLQTPFAWDGTSNLLVEICFDNTSWGSNTTVYATAATNLVWHHHADGAAGCALTGGTVQTSRPNVRLEITASPTSPVTVTIGTGTSTTGYPYTTFWHDGRTQILVTKDEILAAGGFPGEISYLAFNVSSVNTSYQPMNGFTIRVQNYPGTLSGFVSSGWTTVLTTTYTVTSTGWNTHTFTTPFMWNGTDNLLFEVCFDNTSYTSYSRVYATSTVSGRCYYRYTDGAAGCSLTSPTSTTLRPNVRFTITPVAPATLKGYVTNGNTGAPIIGAMVQAGDSITMTDAAGFYQMTIRAGNNTTITCSKLGYDEESVTANIPANSTFQQDFALLENTPPPSVVYASLNAAQTAVDITWGLPMSGYVIIYDDGQFENMTAWAVEGNINALKFTPINQYPVQVTGGMVHIGDGTYPEGGNILTPFQIAVYKDDGTMGLPGTELAVIDVTPADYGWVSFSFNPPVTIQSGNFYIGMIQGGNYPNCAPIAIDETNPSMRSYSRFVTGNGPWVPSGYNDFMIRAFCYGAGGPLDLTETSQPRFVEKQRISKNSLFMKQPRIVQGYEGEAIYKPVPTLSSPMKAVNYSIPTPTWGFVSNNPNASDNAEVVNYGLPLPVIETPQSNPSDGILFDNGPFINSPGTGPGGTDESIIVTGTNSYGFNFNNAVPYTVADDFTVTGTVPWAIGSVEFYGYQTGSSTTSTFTGGYIRIWDGNPSAGGNVIWGDLTTNRMTNTSWINAYRVNVSGGGTTRPIMKVVCSTPGLTLNPGTYWIEFAATGSLASGPWVVPVCLSTPASGNALQFTGTWAPIVSGTAPNTYPQGVPFKLNGAALTGLEYQVWRLKQGDEANPTTWTSLGTTATTSIVDNSWSSLPNGPYRWAVKAKYTGDRWSDATFSNVLGKGWVSNVTFNITLSSQTAVPENVMVYMENTSPTADSIYWGLTPASGTINFPHVWKGNYNINIQKFGYQTYTANVDITENSYTFNILLMETVWPPTDLWVDDMTLMAYWNAPNPQIALFEERWGSGNFTANQWTVNGGNWSVTSGTGNPAPSVQFNWSPQVTNYEQSITSKDIEGQGSPGLYLKYDIYLNNYGTTNENQMAVEIWDGTAWNRLKNYTNMMGSIPWTSESLNISAYTWDTFKIRFLAYGTNSYDINNWNIDNIIVAATLSGKSVLGYDMYLDDIQIGFTTDTSYQIPHNLCTYGHSYTASVDAAYESGASDRDYYTFTAHYLPAPRNLEATPIQDAAYLTWEYPVMGSKLEVLDLSPRTSMPNPTYEYSPMVANQQMINATEAIWDVLFSFNTSAGGYPGIETDGTYIYNCQWSGPNFGKYENQGGTWTLVTEFTIPGASNLRDLAYDGTYFYGGSASTTIYKMDFNTQTLVGTISTSGVSVRHIAYDPANEGFWTGTWTTMALVSMTGATIQTVNTGLAGMYGSAYDDQSTGGPYLWIFDQGGSGVDILQMDIATTTLTGVVHAATDIPGFASGDIAGGLASDNANLVSGKFILLVNIQHSPNIIGAYEITASTGGGGAAPSNLLGYNVYRDGTLISYVEKPTTEYYDLYLDPGQYCYTVTAVYDLEPYGFPAGSTAESVEEGPACVDIDYGFPIPWSEDWASSSFSTNSWSLDPDPSHWKISTMTGNPVPSAEFTWAPPVTDYSFALETPNLTAGLFTCADIWLDFDLKLDDRNQTGNELLKIEIWKNGNWMKMAEFKNEGSFNWENQHIDISIIRGKAFKVRFLATGSNSADILGWFIDNINIYPVVYPALNLTAQNSNLNFDINLQWNSPECPSGGPTGQLKMLKQWDSDPNSTINAYYQQYNYVYGVVYDLTAYPDATLSKIDFHHASWGTYGTWQYKVHVVDWNTYTEIATLGPFLTTGNDIWETDVPLDDIMGYGGHLIGIMLEPMSNSASDAYPCFSGDYTGVQGVSLYGPLPNYASLTPSTDVGDWYQNLWILTNFDDKGLVSPAKVPVSQLNMASLSRKPIVPTLKPTYLIPNQTVITMPTDGFRGVIGYNVYRNGELITPTPITDTTLVDVVDTNGTYCYVVKAVHEGYNSTTIESAASNEVCKTLNVGIIDNQLASLKVYPNPAKDFVNVETTKDIRSIEMINYLGQSVYKQAVDGKGVYKINTRQLESGVYFIRFIDAKGIVTTERVTITK